ncbi:Ring/U-Box superfamily protein, putative isoform 2 [Hibiscus syriacus]|uniref:Ring/U-Box superfamily protein, putative isoform 2 n=1 Tax=Hibiscus syriacus TaxID=106335 RepID=A0A6A3ALX0_HIBSY|nr:Ring/U-Box superfamily protein, putative isoform 2 [Hibiscus syriacus]
MQNFRRLDESAHVFTCVFDLKFDTDDYGNSDRFVDANALINDDEDMFSSSMAIAGLHNVSVLGNSVRRESQPQQSRRQENGSTRPSSILQMWRELEDEHVVNNAQERGSKRIRQQRSCDLSRTVSDSRNGKCIVVSENVSENEFGQWSRDRFGSQTGNADSRNVHLMFPLEITVQGPNGFVKLSERVGTTRECVQLNSQQRGACIQSREAQAADIGGHIERVLNGLVVNQNEYQTERVNRGIRKLCGRQALNDMLKKAESERQTEVQGLLELRAVSNFAHRKRIQILVGN